MNDDELEVTLRRYKGVDPPPSLRNRVTRHTPHLVALGWLDYALAATAALVLIVSSIMRTSMTELPRSAAELAREDNLRALASLIGDDDAQTMADWLIPPAAVTVDLGEEGIR